MNYRAKLFICEGNISCAKRAIKSIHQMCLENRHTSPPLSRSPCLLRPIRLRGCLRWALGCHLPLLAPVAPLAGVPLRLHLWLSSSCSECRRPDHPIIFEIFIFRIRVHQIRRRSLSLLVCSAASGSACNARCSCTSVRLGRSRSSGWVMAILVLILLYNLIQRPNWIVI